MGWQDDPVLDESSAESNFARNSSYAKAAPNGYLTHLSPAEETDFQSWVQEKKVPFDASTHADYDMRGFWKGMKAGDPHAQTGVNANDGQLHFSDYYKTPYHKSFSAESQWAGKGAPQWNEKDQLVLPGGEVVFDERSKAQSAWQDDPVLDEGGAEAPAPQPLNVRDDLTAKEETGRAAGLILRSGINVVAGIPALAADTGVALRNLLTGDEYELPSHMFEKALDEYLPHPETFSEKAVDFVGTALLGSRMPVPSSAKQAPNAIAAATGARNVIAQGVKHDVPVFFDDVTKSAIAKKTSVLAENVPVVGTAGGRVAQSQKAAEAAARVVNKYAPNLTDDVPELVQQGMQRQLATFKTQVGALYAKAAAQLDPAGTVPRTAFNAAIATARAEQSKLGTLAKPEIEATLAKFENAPQGDFSLMRKVREELSGEISGYYTGKNATIGEKGVGILQGLKGALDTDMADFANKVGGGAKNAWKEADSFYRTNLVPFKEAGFRDLAKTAEPEKAWRYLMAQGGLKSRAARMYRSLDDEGRSAVRYGMAKDALESATNTNGTFAPARFAKYMEDHAETVGEFFRGTDRSEIDGFTKLMRAVERSGQTAENPPTGNRLVLPAITAAAGTAAYFNPTAAGIALGGTLGVKTLFQTTRGRNLLVAISEAKGSSQRDLMKRAVGMITVTAAAERSSPEESEPP